MSSFAASLQPNVHSENLQSLGGKLNAPIRSTRKNPSRHLWDKPKPYATIDVAPVAKVVQEPCGMSDIDDCSSFTATTISIQRAKGGLNPTQNRKTMSPHGLPPAAGEGGKGAGVEKVVKIGGNVQAAKAAGASHDAPPPPTPPIANRRQGGSVVSGSEASYQSSSIRSNQSRTQRRMLPHNDEEDAPMPAINRAHFGGGVHQQQHHRCPLDAESSVVSLGSSAVRGRGAANHVSAVEGESYVASSAQQNAQRSESRYTPSLNSMRTGETAVRLVGLEVQLDQERKDRRSLQSKVARAEAELARMERLLRDSVRVF